MKDIVDACNGVCQLVILVDFDVFYLAKICNTRFLKK